MGGKRSRAVRGKGKGGDFRAGGGKIAFSGEAGFFVLGVPAKKRKYPLAPCRGKKIGFCERKEEKHGRLKGKKGRVGETDTVQILLVRAKEVRSGSADEKEEDNADPGLTISKPKGIRKKKKGGSFARLRSYDKKNTIL